MTHGVNEIRAVHCVEVKGSDAAVHEIENLLSRDGSSDEFACRHIIVESFEPLGKPIRHRGATTRGKALGLLEILHRENSRHDRHVDAACANAVEIGEVEVVLEEELR